MPATSSRRSAGRAAGRRRTPGCPRASTCHRPVMPGRTACRACRSAGNASTSRRSAGRGPTRLMSPVSTLSSCGSSSRLVRRRTWPILVTRGVPGELEQRAGALVVGLHGGQLGLGVDAHRAELEHAELGVVPADPLLAEQDRTAVLLLDEDGDDRPAPAPPRAAGRRRRRCRTCAWRPGRPATERPTRRAGASRWRRPTR